jgi:hypothetical protein
MFVEDITEAESIHAINRDLSNPPTLHGSFFPCLGQLLAPFGGDANGAAG